MIQSQQPSIIIAYHFPCLDGIYSLLIFFIYIKNLAYNLKLTINEIIEIMFFQKEIIINNTIHDDFIIQQNQTYFYPDSISNIFYTPFSYTIQSDNIINQLNKLQNKCIFEQSVLVLLDFCGENLQNLLLVIIDHHQACIDILQAQQKIQNLVVYYDNKKSAVMLALDFLNQQQNQYMKINMNDQLKFDNLVHPIIVEKVKELSIYIQDNDIKSSQYKETEPFISFLCSLQINYNVLNNPLCFYQLLNINAQSYIQLGSHLVTERNKKKIVFQTKERKFVGYAVYIQDNSIVNQLGSKLAEFSIGQGYDNLGVIICKNKNDKINYKVRLRGIQGHQSSVCFILAKQFQGGGHPNAASFFISRIKLHQIFKDQ